MSKPKLNIGSGAVILEGYTNVDVKHGGQALPLRLNGGPDVPPRYVADNSVAAIRASHILEHFNFKEAPRALAEWVRVLEPGGLIEIAVPDFDEIAELRHTDPQWPVYLCGAQSDDWDEHLSVWTHVRLQQTMLAAGLEHIQEWRGDPRDTSSHPCSLNLQGRKPGSAGVSPARAGETPAVPPSFAAELPQAPPPGKKRAKMCAIMSCPRLGWNDFWGEAVVAFCELGLPFRRFSGAFWDQGMQNMLEDLVAEGFDLVLTLDYDTLFTADMVRRLFEHCLANPDIDALAALQVKRCSGYPLLTLGEGITSTQVTGQPFQVKTAHFGLTVIRLDALKDLPKPWFQGQPDGAGGWRNDDRLDADIWFWHQWRENGRAVYVDPSVRVGHLELLVSEFDADMQARHVTVKEWREAQKLKGQIE